MAILKLGTNARRGNIDGFELDSANVTPAEGDRYAINGTGVGDFAGQDNKIAEYVDGAWVFITVNDGDVVYDEGTKLEYIYEEATTSFKRTTSQTPTPEHEEVTITAGALTLANNIVGKPTNITVLNANGTIKHEVKDYAGEAYTVADNVITVVDPIALPDGLVASVTYAKLVG